MLKAIAGSNLILGLSEKNLELLKTDKPIKFNLKDLGLQDMNVIIFYGKTEQELMSLVKDGITGATTIIKDNGERSN